MRKSLQGKVIELSYTFTEFKTKDTYYIIAQG